MAVKPVVRRTDTKKSSEFWKYLERTAKEVETWPKWKRKVGRNACD